MTIPYVVTLECAHVITFDVGPSSVKDIVWCIPCDRGRAIAEYRYGNKPRKVNSQCRAPQTMETA